MENKADVVAALADLCDRFHMLWLRYNVVFREPTPAAPPYIPMAETLMRGLLEEDRSAVTVARSLVEQAEQDRPEFWATSLGRVLYAAGGYPHTEIPQSWAAGILGCSRQWVHALVTSGQVRSEEGVNPAARKVNALDVRLLLKTRIDKLVK